MKRLLLALLFLAQQALGQVSVPPGGSIDIDVFPPSLVRSIPNQTSQPGQTVAIDLGHYLPCEPYFGSHLNGCVWSWVNAPQSPSTFPIDANGVLTANVANTETGLQVKVTSNYGGGTIVNSNTFDWNVAGGQPVVATGYFVDCANGSDSTAGTDPTAPWKSLPKVTSTVTATGADVWIEGHSTCQDQLTISWSGTPSDHVVIGSYYLNGPTAYQSTPDNPTAWPTEYTYSHGRATMLGTCPTLQWTDPGCLAYSNDPRWSPYNNGPTGNVPLRDSQAMIDIGADNIDVQDIKIYGSAGMSVYGEAAVSPHPAYHDILVQRMWIERSFQDATRFYLVNRATLRDSVIRHSSSSTYPDPGGANPAPVSLQNTHFEQRNDYLVEGNDLADVSTGFQYFFNVQGIILRGNRIGDIYGNRPCFYGDDGDDIVIEYNICYSGGSGIDTVQYGSRGISFTYEMPGGDINNPLMKKQKPLSNVTVRGNMVTNTQGCIEFGDPSGGQLTPADPNVPGPDTGTRSHEGRIYNNTCLNTFGIPLQMQSEYHVGANGFQVRDNIFQTTGATPCATYAVTATAAAPTFDHNMWSALPTAACRGAGDVTGTALVVGTNMDTRTAANPPTPADFALQAGSPGLAAGTPLSLVVLNSSQFPQYTGVKYPCSTFDFAGSAIDAVCGTRDATTPDIGAQQRTAAQPPPPIQFVPGTMAGAIVPGNTNVVNLTTGGAHDWMQWGYPTAYYCVGAAGGNQTNCENNGGKWTVLTNRKANVLPRLFARTDLTTPAEGFAGAAYYCAGAVGANQAACEAAGGTWTPGDAIDSPKMTWTDGTPTASKSNFQGGIYNWSKNAGYKLTAQAGTHPRTVVVYGGGSESTHVITASLSDSSVTPYTTTLTAPLSEVTVLTINYTAGSDNQSLTITNKVTSNAGGTVAINAMTLKEDDGIANNPPLIRPVGDKEVVVNSALSFSVVATDFEGTAITLSTVGPLPSGAAFADNHDKTGVFSWTPTVAGNYAITFRATDAGGLGAEETINIKVLASAAGTPTALAKSGRWFTYNGAPIYLIGGDSSSLAADPAFDYERVFDVYKTYGINRIRLWGDPYWDPDGLLHPWVYTGNATTGTYNLDAWNAAFFTRYKAVIESAKRHGIMVEISIFDAYPNATWWWPSTVYRSAWNAAFNTNGAFFGPSSGIQINTFSPRWYDLTLGQVSNTGHNLLYYQHALIDKMVAEFGTYENVFFEVMNEGYSGATTANAVTAGAWFQHMADYIDAKLVAQGTPRLVSVVVDNDGVLNQGAYVWDRASVGILDAHLRSTTDVVTNVSSQLHAAQVKNKILSQNEGGGGDISNFYFNIAIDPITNTEVPATIYGPGVDYNTRDMWAWFTSGGHSNVYEAMWVNTPGWYVMGQRIRAFRDIIATLDFTTLSPVDGFGAEYDTLITAGPAGANHQVAATPGVQYVAYFWGTPAGTPVTMNLTTGHVYDFKWYDPRTGGVLASGVVTGSATASIQSPLATAWSGSSGLVLTIKAG